MNSNFTTGMNKPSKFIAETYGTKIKVKTQNGVIYLLGKITEEQGEAAVAATQKSFGVRKIVKVFDYVESPE